MEREKLRFSVGDTVRIVTNEPRQKLGFVPEMQQYMGRTAFVDAVDEYGTDYWVYRLGIDDGRWSWEDFWLEPAENEQESVMLPEYEELYEFLNGGVQWA